MVAPATLVPMIDNLESKKLVIRKTDAKDRRKNPIHLTQKGIDIVAKIPLMDEKNKLMRSVDKLGEQKTSKLITLLEEIVTELSGDTKLIEAVSENLEKENGSKLK